MYRKIRDLLQAGQSVAVATVTASRGSTPREIGARMLVVGEGRIAGTVGGGCGEAQVLWDAVQCLSEGRPKMSVVDLTGELTDESPTNCGGVMEIFIDPMLPAEAGRPGLPSARLAERLAAAEESREPVALATLVATPDPLRLPLGLRAVVWGGGAEGLEDLPAAAAIREGAVEAILGYRSRRITVPTEEGGEAGVFLEVIAPPEEVVIVGAGHIAVPLARMAKSMDFEVTVLDDRSAFANRLRFPEADRVIAASIEKTLAELPVGPHTYLVLVTRGHTLDQAALLRVIDRPAAYIGMIGSKRRVRAVFDHLRRMGVPEAHIRKVYAPIGLSIGAETPAEIAVSILAEIVAVRRSSRSRRHSVHMALAASKLPAD
jgi:xanthine dehydrogenase accessory factor